MKKGAPTTVLLDIDGVLNPFVVETPPGFISYRDLQTPWLVKYGRVFTIHLNPEHGVWLHTLTESAEVIWCSGWGKLADPAVGRELGVTGLRHIDWGHDPLSRKDHSHGSWKTTLIPKRLLEGPVVWIDDEVTETDYWYLLDRSRHPIYVHQADPTKGLSPAELQAIDAWVKDPYRYGDRFTARDGNE